MMTANQIYAVMLVLFVAVMMWKQRDKRTKVQKEADELKEALGYEVK